MKPEYSRRETIDALRHRIEGYSDRLLLQHCPYTMVRLKYWWFDAEYVAERGAKCKWPDVWSDEEGVRIVVERASRAIANAIYEEHHGDPSLYLSLFGPHYLSDVPSDEMLLKTVPLC